jgi:signal transduction histidine kinase
VQVEVSQAKDSVRISVSDHGIGIAKERKEYIFDRFERAVSHSNISGLGLGLYISKQIVDAHGGNIELKTELGEGSTFTVELPKMGKENL